MAKITWTPEIVPNGGVDESRSPTQIEDNAWTAASNVEPLPDGVRQRPGYQASNTLALTAVGASIEAGTEDHTFTDTSSEFISQKFTVGGSDIDIYQVAVRLKLNDPADSPAAPNVAVALYDDDTGEPDTAVTDAGFADFSDLVPTTVTAEYKWYYFTLAATVTLTASAVHHLVVRYTGAAAGDTLDMEESSSTGTNEVYDSTDGSTWSVDATARLNYRLYHGTAAITGIFDYRLSDASTSRHLVYHDKTLYKNDSGTMTPLIEVPRASMTSDDDLYPSFTVGQDRCFLAHGTDTPRKFYVLSGNEHYENTGISAPTTVPTATNAGAGASLSTGEWFVDYYYWNNDTGQPSNRKYQGISTDAVSATIASGEELRITGLPTEVARDGDRATHIRIEIKHETEDTIFRFAGTAEGQVALGTTTATITADNTTLEGEYFHVVPPSHTMNVVAENRQFVAGDPSFPYRVWHSAIEGLDAYYESFAATAYRDFGKGDGDYITALAFIPPRHLLVGFKNSLWAIDARQPGTSDAIRLADGIGVAHHNAFIVVGRRLYFVSDAERTKGLFVWQGSGEPMPLVKIDDTFKALEQPRIKYANCAHLAPGDNRFQVWTLLTAAANGTEHDYVIIYDYVLDSFAFYSYAENPCVIGNIEQDGVTTVFLGTYDGFEREADVTTQDINDSTKLAEDISSTVTLKAYDFGSQELLKKARFLDYLASGKSSGGIGFSLTPDFGTRPAATASLDHLSAADVIVLGTFAFGDTSTFGALDPNVLGRVGIRAFGKYFQPAFNAENDWQIKTFSLGIQPTGRRK